MDNQDRLILLLRDMREGMGEYAWVIFGVLLLLGIALSFLTLRWILSGGMKRNQPIHFLVEHPEVKDVVRPI